MSVLLQHKQTRASEANIQPLQRTNYFDSSQLFLITKNHYDSLNNEIMQLKENLANYRKNDKTKRRRVKNDRKCFCYKTKKSFFKLSYWQKRRVKLSINNLIDDFKKTLKSKKICINEINIGKTTRQPLSIRYFKQSMVPSIDACINYCDNYQLNDKAYIALKNKSFGNLPTLFKLKNVKNKLILNLLSKKFMMDAMFHHVIK